MVILKELFTKKLTEMLASETESLVRGAGENYSEIQSLRGRIRGLEDSLELFEEIWNKLVDTENGLLEEE
jgi:hypothetical protein